MLHGSIFGESTDYKLQKISLIYCSAVPCSLQWNLSNMDTLGTKGSVPISEVSLLKLQRCPLREVPLYRLKYQWSTEIANNHNGTAMVQTSHRLLTPAQSTTPLKQLQITLKMASDTNPTQNKPAFIKSFGTLEQSLSGISGHLISNIFWRGHAPGLPNLVLACACILLLLLGQLGQAN